MQILLLHIIRNPVIVLCFCIFFSISDHDLGWLLQGLVHTQAFVTVLIKIGNCIRVRNLDMGSEGPKAVTIHVTGFKKFQGVAENPTETIVSNLKDFVEKRGLPPGATLGSCTILETAGDGALPLLYQTLESCISKTDITSHEQIIWVSCYFLSCSSVWFYKSVVILEKYLEEINFFCTLISKVNWLFKNSFQGPQVGFTTSVIPNKGSGTYWLKKKKFRRGLRMPQQWISC